MMRPLSDKKRGPAHRRLGGGTQTISSTSTSVVRAHGLQRDELGSAQIFSGRLAIPAVCNDIERHFLPLIKGAHAGAFDRADMNKDILAVFHLNEAVALLVVEPLHSTFIHEFSFH